MNDSMSNFACAETDSPHLVAPGQRPRSTIAPTLVLEDGEHRVVIGLPIGARIPTVMLQVLQDRMTFGRVLTDAIGDTRVHFDPGWRQGELDAINAEQYHDPLVVAGLREAGREVELVEVAGTGRHFGGVNAVEIHLDGLLTGYADPRRSNEAVGF